MAFILSILVGIATAPISYHMTQLPNYARAYYTSSPQFQLALLRWQCQEVPKHNARLDAEWNQRMREWNQKQAELNARDQELRRQRDLSKAKKSGG